ncbi:MAG: hypothetical protein Q9173_001093 [Seirophora scorigena]
MERAYFQRAEEREDSGQGVSRYAETKLMQVLGVRGLTAQMDQSKKLKVMVNTLTPGFCHSECDWGLSNFKR